MIDRQFICV